jgi:tRNA dimethylallyltransferase
MALRFDGEIVGADSRQVYRYMDIGTAKPSEEDRRIVRHHLIDIIDPDDNFGLAEYQRLAYQAINGILERKRLPFLVGGTGQYIKAITEGWDIPKVAPDIDLRNALEKRARTGGGEALYNELLELDPEAAKKIDKRNTRRVIRALEVSKTSGSAFSKLRGKNTPPYEIITVGLTAERKELYRRTDARVDRMIESGLVDEVKKLIAMGYRVDLPSMSGIGYRQIGKYLDGEMELNAASDNIKVETHRFIRHQYNWFRLSDKNIKWFDVEDPELTAKTENVIGQFVAR